MNNYSAWVAETDPAILRERYVKILQEAGFTILNECEYFFTPHGYTCLWLLGESHFAVHTFPEENKTYIELSSCIDAPYDNFINIQRKKFTADYFVK